MCDDRRWLLKPEDCVDERVSAARGLKNDEREGALMMDYWLGWSFASAKNTL